MSKKVIALTYTISLLLIFLFISVFLLCRIATDNDIHLSKADTSITASPVLQNGKININKATVEDLMIIPGIGEKTATRIIEYRHTHGKIRNLKELDSIQGIGPKTLELLEDYIMIGD